MKLGLYGINFGVCVDPEAAAAVARAAEAAGFESLWTAEHVVLPDPKTPDSPIPAQTPLLDPAVALAHAAAHTRTIRLGTGIIILPQRNPVVLAKELASIDVLSGGRLIFGVGAGYLRSEFAALGSSFDDRGERTNEYIEAIRALWTQAKPRFEGRTVAFAGIDAQPRPVQQPHPPIVVGGMSPPALRRAARQGNGWYGFAIDAETTERCAAGLREAQQQVERPAELGPLELSVTPAGPVDADAVSRFEDLGVDRLILLALAGSPEDVIAFVEKTANALLGSRGRC
jgi:probable F420-dependent oxidoreductase